MSEWKKVKFLDFIVLQRGFDLTKDSIKDGPYPVVCSTSIMGYHNNYKVEGPGVVTGRSGTLGETQYVKGNFWPHNTTLFVKDFKGNNRQFVYYFLKNFDIASMGGGAAIPSLNRNVLSNLSVTIPDLSIQNNIANILSRYYWRKQRSDSIRNGSLTSTSLDTKTPKSWMVCQRGGRRRRFVRLGK